MRSGQQHLLAPTPALYLRLPFHCAASIREGLRVEQTHRPSIFRVAAAFAAVVIFDALVEIIGDACVESPVAAFDDVEVPCR